MSITKGQSCTVADPGYGSGGEKKKKIKVCVLEEGSRKRKEKR